MKKYIVLFLLLALMTAAAPASPAIAASSMVEIKASALNFRTGPGIHHSRVDVLPRGMYVTLLSRQGEWLHVRLPWGRTGWIFGGNDYTALHPIGEYLRTTASLLNVRTGPGIGHPVTGQLPRGTAAPALETHGGWHRIIFDTGRTGWVSGAYTEPVRTIAGRNEERPSLRGKTIVVDPGHGGHDPGAVGRNSNLTEKFVNLDTALRLARLLEEAGARVILTRRSDTFISLAQRANIANSSGGDLLVSIHANAHPDRNVGGTETYYNTYFRPADSRRLASAFQQELVSTLGLRDIGVKTANFYVIRYSRIPSVLVELAFLSNVREESLLNQASFRQRCAEGLFRGIYRYFQ